MSHLQKGELLYEGKAKKVFRTGEEGLVLVEYKDDATAFNGEKKGTIHKKGVVNNQISTILFSLLNEEGVENHFKTSVGEREMICFKVDIIPLEVILRNRVAGSLAKRLGLQEGTILSEPVVEFCYKRDDLGDPMINASHVQALGLCSVKELARITEIGLKTNRILSSFFLQRGLILVDFKLEFGWHQGKILLADEISPDTCRLWDANTLEKLDKDRFRRDLGKVEESYQEVLQRVQR